MDFREAWRQRSLKLEAIVAKQAEIIEVVEKALESFTFPKWGMQYETQQKTLDAIREWKKENGNG